MPPLSLRKTEFSLPGPAPKADGAPPQARDLWLALALPALALEVRSRAGQMAVPEAVTDGKGARRRILCASQAAESSGIRARMGVSAAYALVPGLRVFSRDKALEAAGLERLAAWAMQFTSWVSLVPDGGLLLEVGGSTRLFDGLDPLIGQVSEGLTGLGYRAAIALAPVPRAAWVSAHAGVPLRVTTMGALVAALAPLPLMGLDLPERVGRSLEGMGVQTIGQLLRLPRAGLARRFGRDMVVDLDRLVGRCPDPRPRFVPPPTYAGSLELPLETSDRAHLSLPLARLLRELEGFLRARDAAVLGIGIALEHRALPATRFTLGLAAPARDANRIHALVEERLARLMLPRPVWRVGLYTDAIVPFVARGTDLFGRKGRQAESVTDLIERLRARLGRDAVQGLCVVPDYRPEKAWQICEPGERRELPILATRPLWLLETPRPLGDQVSRLRFRTGPERIETGWWDGYDVARDYFVVRNDRDETCWVFRDRRTGRWYLHGLFG